VVCEWIRRNKCKGKIIVVVKNKKGLIIVDAWYTGEWFINQPQEYTGDFVIPPIFGKTIPKWSAEVKDNVRHFSEYLDYVCDYERSQGTTIIHMLGLSTPALILKHAGDKTPSQMKIKKGDIVTNAFSFKTSYLNKKLDIKYFAGFHFGKCIQMHIARTSNSMSNPNIALNLCMILPPIPAAVTYKNSWKEEMDKKDHDFFMWSPWGFEMILEKS